MGRQIPLFTLAFILWMSFSFSSTFGQTATTGTIEGLVTDTNNARVPGIVVSPYLTVIT